MNKKFKKILVVGSNVMCGLVCAIGTIIWGEYAVKALKTDVEDF